MAQPALLALTATLLAAPVAPAGASSAELPTLTRVGETVLDATARGRVSYASTANVGSYQQDALLTHDGHQYAAWYAADRTLVVARRTLVGDGTAGEWQALRLDAVLWADDSHNTISMGVSPRDGRLHIALATHTGQVRYVRSAPGLVNTVVTEDEAPQEPAASAEGSEPSSPTDPSSPAEPATRPWASTSFDAVLGHMPGMIHGVWGWTYPTFELHDGTLFLSWREGNAVAGSQQLARYRNNGVWHRLGKFTGPGGEWSNAYGTSTSRNAYLHGLTSNPVTGDLEATWTWRENQSTQDPRCAEVPANRDLAFARSPDGGRTWLNAAGVVVGVTGTDDLISAEDDTTVAEIGVEAAMINQESQTVDSAGRLHVLTSRIDDATLTDLGGCLTGDYYAGRAAHAHPVHHWRDADGWHSTTLPFPLGTGGRSQVAVGPDDTLYVVLPSGAVAAATASSRWSDWTQVRAADGASISEHVLDRQRLDVDGVLSVIRQETGVPRHADSALVLTDLRIGTQDAAASTLPGDRPTTVTAPLAAPWGGSRPSWPQASASSVQPNFPAHFAVDGSPYTYWSSGHPVLRTFEGAQWAWPTDARLATGGGATTTTPQTLALEWNRPRWIGSLTYTPHEAAGPRDFTVEGRTPAGEWRPLKSVVAQPSEPATLLLPRTRVQGVRIVAVGGHDPEAVRISEVTTDDRTPDALAVVERVALRSNGRARVPVTVSEPGLLRVLPNRVVAGVDTVLAGTPGTPVRTTLVVKPTGTAAQRLSRAGCRTAEQAQQATWRTALTTWETQRKTLNRKAKKMKPARLAAARKKLGKRPRQPAPITQTTASTRITVEFAPTGGTASRSTHRVTLARQCL